MNFRKDISFKIQNPAGSEATGFHVIIEILFHVGYIQIYGYNMYLYSLSLIFTTIREIVVNMGRGNIGKIYIARLEKIEVIHLSSTVKKEFPHVVQFECFTNLKKAVNYYNSAIFKNMGFEPLNYHKILRILKDKDRRFFITRAKYIPAGTDTVYTTGSKETYEIPKQPIDMHFIIQPKELK
jgi:hypothetical protein